jgi:hypothetical protein
LTTQKRKNLQNKINHTTNNIIIIIIIIIQHKNKLTPQTPSYKERMSTAGQQDDTTVKQQQQQQQQDRISELRVAQTELVSGDTTGKVYMRLSDGAVGFLIDRSKAKAEIATRLRQEILNNDDK